MGNHSIDCKHCGQDQRLTGDRCCAEAIAEEEAQQRARRDRDEANVAYLAKYGLCPWDNRLYATDVVEAFKYLEAKGLLISKRGISPKPLRRTRV